MRVELFFLLSFPLGLTVAADNKLSDTLKNMTLTRNNATTSQTNDENSLKSEIKQYLRECGADVPEEDMNGENYNQRFPNNRSNSYDYGNRNRYSNNYGNDNYGSGHSDNYENRNNYGNRHNNNHGGSRFNGNPDESNSNNQEHCDGTEGNRRGNAYSNYDQQNNNRQNSQNRPNYGNNGSGSRYSYGNCNYGNNGYGSAGGGYQGDNQNNHGHHGSNSNSNRGTYDLNYGHSSPNNEGSNSQYGNSGYRSRREGSDSNHDTDASDGDLFYFRTRRSSNNNEQCISQCIFGYLEVLDDNRVPSETMMIKWLQDHLTNNIKRIRALREARRCFARLATTDTEDGCEFSKALSNCLDLDIE